MHVLEMSFAKTAILALVLLHLSISGLGAADLPSAVVPGGLGLNYYDDKNNKQHLDMIRAAGGSYIRIDAPWHDIERVQGQYDFSGLDKLYEDAAARGIRALIILSYGNPHYSDNQFLWGTSPESPAWRQGFADYAAAMANHFKDKARKPIYEFWNEPNSAGFWPGGSNVNQYMQLAHQALPAMRAADPTCTIVGPALYQINNSESRTFLESTFQQGLLNLVDAVSVHPYTAANGTPETMVSSYNAVRNLINQYKPGVPIISSEWGYSTAAPGITPQIQANNLARMFLVNLSQNIPLSIWFNWNDMSADPSDPEMNYGIVTADLDPKPAYYAMQFLTSSLKGTTFSQRLRSTSLFFPDRDWLLLFTLPNGHETLAAWTTGNPRTVFVPNWGFLHLTNSPQYINPVPVPEPSALTLLGAGVTGSVLLGGRNKGRIRGVGKTRRPARATPPRDTCQMV
jgi:hypothetical protein